MMDYLVCKKTVRVSQYLTPWKYDKFKKGEKYEFIMENRYASNPLREPAVRITNVRKNGHSVFTWLRPNRDPKVCKLMDLSYDPSIYHPFLFLTKWFGKKRGVYVWDYFATEQDYIKILRKEKLENIESK